MIRNQRRHPNPQVHIEPIPQLARNPIHNPLALLDIFPGFFITIFHPVILSAGMVREAKPAAKSKDP